MQKEKIEEKIGRIKFLIMFFETFFVLIMPVYLYGWKVGLLVASGLTSLLHIVDLLKIISKQIELYLVAQKLIKEYSREQLDEAFEYLRIKHSC